MRTVAVLIRLEKLALKGFCQKAFWNAGFNKKKTKEISGMSDSVEQKIPERERIDWGDRVEQGQKGLETVKISSCAAGELLQNAHIGLPDPGSDVSRCSLVTGDFLYFHYGCDGKDDRGWGCGYRTLQTICSWLHLNRPHLKSHEAPPSLPDIQKALIAIGDKPPSFLGSREWIGTFEAAIVLDHLYDMPCKITHVRKGGAEVESMVEELHEHFRTHGTPVMMGGDRDNSSKGILGVSTSARGTHLLVMDPHYYGPPLSRESAQKLRWVSWKKVSSLDSGSFYNLCLPQTARKEGND